MRTLALTISASRMPSGWVIHRPHGRGWWSATTDDMVAAGCRQGLYRRPPCRRRQFSVTQRSSSAITAAGQEGQMADSAGGPTANQGRHGHHENRSDPVAMDKSASPSAASRCAGPWAPQARRQALETTGRLRLDAGPRDLLRRPRRWRLGAFQSMGRRRGWVGDWVKSDRAVARPFLEEMAAKLPRRKHHPRDCSKENRSGAVPRPTIRIAPGRDCFWCGGRAQYDFGKPSTCRRYS